jgi:hypothetical protein
MAMRILALLLCLGGVGRAEEFETPEAARRWHFGIEAVTDFPLYIGGQVWVQLPHRLRLTTSFGEMPDFYMSTINGIATHAGVYSNATGELIKEAIDRALSWRIQLGWVPWKNHGAYFEVGFGVIELQAGLALADVINAATGYPIPQIPGIGFGFKIDSIVETVGGEVGWIWYPWRNLTVRVGVAFHAPVAAQVSLEAKFITNGKLPFARFAEDYMAELLRRYLYVPTIALAVGWRIY